MKDKIGGDTLSCSHYFVSCIKLMDENVSLVLPLECSWIWKQVTKLIALNKAWVKQLLLITTKNHNKKGHGTTKAKNTVNLVLAAPIPFVFMTKNGSLWRKFGDYTNYLPKITKNFVATAQNQSPWWIFCQCDKKIGNNDKNFIMIFCLSDKSRWPIFIMVTNIRHNGEFFVIMANFRHENKKNQTTWKEPVAEKTLNIWLVASVPFYPRFFILQFQNSLKDGNCSWAKETF